MSALENGEASGVLSNPSSNSVLAAGAARKRVSQACDKCRSRKDKCDGRKPKCSACVKRKLLCNYNPSGKKRGLPEGYVRNLEGHKQRQDCYVEDLEIICALSLQRSSKDRGVTALLDVNKMDFLKDELLQAWNDEDVAEGLRTAWRQSQTFRELRTRHSWRKEDDSSLFGRKHTSRDGSHADDDHHEVHSDAESLITVEDPTRKAERRLRPNQMIDAIRFQYPQTSHNPTIGHSHYSIPVQLELPSRAWHLLNIYFAHTHSWLPIVEKHDILRIYHGSSKTGSQTPTEVADSGSQAVLWSILAFADVQYVGIHGLDRTELGTESPSTEDMQLFARSLIPREDGAFEIEHIQALLVLSLLMLGSDKLQAAWLLSGEAVRIAFQLGLHQPKSESTLKPREKHVFLGCFAVDTLISARLKMPPHLTSDDIDAIGGQIEESGLEEWDTWSDVLGSKRGSFSSTRPPLICSTFNKLIVTLRCLNRLARGISTSNENFPLTTSIISYLNASFNNEKNSELSLATNQRSKMLPHHFNLHLTYLTARMTYLLCRYKSPLDINSNEATLAELSSVVLETSQMLNDFEDSFGLAIAPPITEYFISVLQENHHLLGSKLRAHGSEMESNWKSTLQVHVAGMYKIWPIFSSLHAALQDEQIMEGGSDITPSESNQNGFGVVTYFGSNPNPTLSASNTSSNEIRNSANESNNTSKAVTEDQFATEIAEILGNFTPRSRIESASMAAPYAPTLPALNADSIPSSATINSIEDIGAGHITERTEQSLLHL
jgi:hypothetical protein